MHLWEECRCRIWRSFWMTFCDTDLLLRQSTWKWNWNWGALGTFCFEVQLQRSSADERVRESNHFYILLSIIVFHSLSRKQHLLTNRLYDVSVRAKQCHHLFQDVSALNSIKTRPVFLLGAPMLSDWFGVNGTLIAKSYNLKWHVWLFFLLKNRPECYIICLKSDLSPHFWV